MEGRIADCNIANINIFSSADYNQVRAVIVGHLSLNPFLLPSG